VRTVSLPVGVRPPAVSGPLRSKRLLSLAGDDRLVEQIRRGNEAAFEVVFERHGSGILSFCRHMLRSAEEAEDAVQQTFASAYKALLRDERAILLKPWLYRIARNRCLSLLRAQREPPAPERELATAGLDEQVERRAELRELLHDLRELPDEQRAALLLAELADLSHAEVAEVLGCEVPKVKALVFRARSGLAQRQEARKTPCEEIREQIANLRGGSLRRSGLRHHLRDCPGCRAYRAQVAQQRRMLAAVLPVTPSLALKSSVLGAVGLGGGSAGGAAAAGGLGTAATASFGSATAAKVAIVGVIAGGAMAGGAVVRDEHPGPAVPSVQQLERPATAAPPGTAAPGRGASDRQGAAAAEPGARATGRGRHGRPGSRRGASKSPGSRGKGHGKRSGKAKNLPRGRGAPATPPVRRGPPQKAKPPARHEGSGRGSPHRGADPKVKDRAGADTE
jgi:RNA polymerase sigma factor (sigma-70 family)